MRVLLLTLFMSIASVVHSAPPPIGTHPVTIVKDRGGVLKDYQIFRHHADSVKREIRIVKLCASGCTILLTSPNACVYPDARIGFHGSFLPKRLWKKYNWSAQKKYETDKIMSRYLPTALQAQFMSEWRHMVLYQMHWMSGQEVVRVSNGEVKLCK